MQSFYVLYADNTFVKVMPDEEFVTKAECYKTHAQITNDFGTIKKALVGEDLRGGLVKDVADTKKDVAEIKTAMKTDRNISDKYGHNGGLGRKERAMLYVALITSLSGTSGIIVVEIIRNFH